MKYPAIKILFFSFYFLILGSTHTLMAQNAENYFNNAAKQYVNNDKAATGQTLAEGLSKYPNDQKLRALLDKLQKEEEEEEKQQNQDQQSQDKDQQQESQDQKKGEGEEQTQDESDVDPDKTDEQRGEKSQQEQPSEELSDQKSDLSEREKSMQQMKERLQEMNITPEQAAQILDAMNNAELRHIQQNRRIPTKKPERGAPDW
ncbi:hypothetical protein [Anditalea andensis]|uniref:Uncharacterized protein n=1 Tax=Anditalea andensis TaxID=1048983 RepID=A0A074KY93_9BACT|nr:hypothetical protein [Anditalea andensis]KEO72563.1 hypothetical protein EL17_17655 [Anditalea andensis]